MKQSSRIAAGLIIAGAGMAGVLGVSGVGTGEAAAAPSVCGALPGDSAVAKDCSAVAGRDAISLAIADNGGKATAEGNNLSGPAAIAIGPGATVEAIGVRPGLAIAIAGPGAHVVLDGKNGPVCSGNGMAFAGDFQTLKGCWQ